MVDALCQHVGLGPVLVAVVGVCFSEVVSNRVCQLGASGLQVHSRQSAWRRQLLVPVRCCSGGFKASESSLFHYIQFATAQQLLLQVPALQMQLLLTEAFFLLKPSAQVLQALLPRQRLSVRVRGPRELGTSAAAVSAYMDRQEVRKVCKSGFGSGCRTRRADAGCSGGRCSA